jgi:TDG/mug DNA glycosylase family protein
VSDDASPSSSARVTSFAPVVNDDARILILGSMPGVASLAANQYYAHPHNAFWKIMARVFGFVENVSYDTRIAALQHGGIALWDVLQSCVRPGSLDTAIHTASVQANAIPGLLHDHPGIVRVCCNGGAADKFYRKLVVPNLTNRPLDYLRLPSTSPAHAAMRFEQKLALWRDALANTETLD